MGERSSSGSRRCPRDAWRGGSDAPARRGADRCRLPQVQGGCHRWQTVAVGGGGRRAEQEGGGAEGGGVAAAAAFAAGRTRGRGGGDAPARCGADRGGSVERCGSIRTRARTCAHRGRRGYGRGGPGKVPRRRLAERAIAPAGGSRAVSAVQKRRCQGVAQGCCTVLLYGCTAGAQTAIIGDCRSYRPV